MSIESIGASSSLGQSLPGVTLSVSVRARARQGQPRPAVVRSEPRKTPRPQSWKHARVSAHSPYKGAGYRSLRVLASKRELSREHYVVLEGQGGLLQARVHIAHRGRAAKSRERGLIRGFSKGARANMLRMVARIDHSVPCQMLTLTQLADLSTFGFADAERCMDAFYRRLLRLCPGGAGVWRKGLQDRKDAGRIPAVHYHLLLWGCEKLTQRLALQWWRELTGGAVDERCVDLRDCYGKKGASLYAAKYVSKVESDALDYVTYQAGDEGRCGRWIDRETGVILAEGDGIKGPDLSTGRWWGVWCRIRLPWAVRMVRRVALGSMSWWFRFKRVARHVWQGVNGVAFNGFTLFVESPEAWILLPECLGA